MRPTTTRPARLLPLLLLGSLLALPAAAAPAAAPAPEPPKVVPVPPLPGPATPAPAVRRPTERLRTLRAERDLTYQEAATADPTRQNLLQRLLLWLLEKISSFRSTTGGNIAWNTVFYGLAIGLLLFAVLKFLQLDVARLFGRSSKAQALGYELGQENIHELNFADAIAEAEAAGNLRLATRLGYLHLLKQLTDQGLIDWQPDKTNQTYLRELATARPALRPSFTELTRQFEYVWYGEFPLRPAAYRQLRDSQQEISYELRVRS